MEKNQRREMEELKKGGRSFGKGKMENQKREKEEFEKGGGKITNGRSQNQKCRTKNETKEEKGLENR